MWASIPPSKPVGGCPGSGGAGGCASGCTSANGIEAVGQRAEYRVLRRIMISTTRPEQEQRHGDAFPAVLDEGFDAASLDDQAREKPGDQEERRHAEHVDDVIDDGCGRARLVPPQRGRVSFQGTPRAECSTTPSRSAYARTASSACNLSTDCISCSPIQITPRHPCGRPSAARAGVREWRGLARRVRGALGCKDRIECVQIRGAKLLLLHERVAVLEIVFVRPEA